MFGTAGESADDAPAPDRMPGDLAHRRAHRGADAIHLANALAIESADLIVAVWDRRLHAGATAEHLLVAPATLA